MHRGEPDGEFMSYAPDARSSVPPSSMIRSSERGREIVKFDTNNITLLCVRYHVNRPLIVIITNIL
jgi:hypothetical protein